MHILYSLSEPHARVFRNEYPRLYVLLPLLANLASSHLVPYSSDVRRLLYLAALHALTGHISRHLFTLKFIVTPTAGLVFFVWCIVKAKGVGPIISQPSTLHGSDLSWSMLVSLMSCVSNMATLVTYVFFVSYFYCHHVGLMSCDLDSNAPDFASRAKTPGAALWPQLFAVPLSFSVVSFIGITVSSSSQAIYGEAIWSPIDLLGRFLDDSPSSATRFGVCFFQSSDLPSLKFLIVSSVGLVHFLRIYHCTGISFPSYTIYVYSTAFYSLEQTYLPTPLVQDVILLPYFLASL